MRDRLPRPTIRLRLTALYGGLFLVSGAALLAITYLLVVHGTVGFVFAGQGGSGGVEVVQQAPASAGARKTEPTDTHRGGDPRGPRVSPARAAAQASALESQARRQHASELHQLLRQSAIALAGMAVVSIALGWVVAGRVLRPLRTITATARDISAANLQARLALHGPDDEIKEL